MTGVQRPSLTKEYIQNQSIFLHALYPEIDIEEIKSFVRDMAQTKLKRPKAQIIKHVDFNSKLEDIDLLTHLKNVNNKTITPSGSWYETSDVKQAPDVDFMLSRLDLRKKHKNKMLAYRETGQTQLALLEDFRQGMVKIGTNSVIGASGNEFSILFDLENFNGITSLSRHGIMGAYIFTERFLAHNMHFLSDEEVINHVITTVRACPPKEQVIEIIEKYKIVEPFPNEIIDSLRVSMQNYYKLNTNSIKLITLIEGLERHERVFLAYHLNMRYLVEMNPDMFRIFIDNLFDVDDLQTSDVEVTNITKLYDEDLLQLIAVTCGTLINGRVLSKMHDSLDTDGNYDPETVKKIITIGNYIKNNIENLNPLFELFMYAKCTLPSIDNQKDLTRRSVILSDTDSVVFSTNNWVQWYCGKTDMSSKATRVASLVMYWLSKALTAYIFHISYHRGALNQYTKMIKIKNEYTFPILVRCDIAKHYFGWITIQEGKILPKPKLEIKGLQFKTSTLPGITNKFTEQLIIDILNELTKNGSLDINDYIARVLEYEHTVYSSLKAGELTYVNYNSMKHKEEYKTPEKSIYKNYQYWQNIFSKKYGDIKLPTKVPTLTFVRKIFASEKYLNWLAGIDKSIYNKLMEYSEQERANITRLPLSSTNMTIPEELIPCVDIRSIIYKNICPAHLVLRSFKVDLNNTNGKKKLLLSDIYTDLNIL